MFALIKWVEDEKFSILPTAHIRGFDEDKYSGGLEENDVYFVEWHQGVKEPKGGWPVFEASIIKIAERERTLQIKLKELEEQLTKPDTLKRKSKPSIKLLEAADVREEPAAKKKGQLTDLPNDLKLWNERKIEHLQRVINQLREENMNLNKENERLKNEILKKIPPLLLATEHLLQEPMKSNADAPDMFMMSKTPSHVPLSHAPKPVESNADVLDVPKAPSTASLSAKCSSDANYVSTFC
ncbi:uncharacterized protein LOC132140183 [Carassius carassius]|uniref:uncharacterized protein LOC132140183 n=1 Tax=Carassius carassius TaxID=217509 RepID=UPI002868FA20|nr:uncharacterized protein LOC132140183 [Carassius carassius]